MQLCVGIPDPKCEGKVTRATGQCNNCLAYHSAPAVSAPEGEAKLDPIREALKAMLTLADMEEIPAMVTRRRYWSLLQATPPTPPVARMTAEEFAESFFGNMAMRNLMDKSNWLKFAEAYAAHVLAQKEGK